MPPTDGSQIWGHDVLMRQFRVVFPLEKGYKSWEVVGPKHQHTSTKHQHGDGVDMHSPLLSASTVSSGFNEWRGFLCCTDMYWRNQKNQRNILQKWNVALGGWHLPEIHGILCRTAICCVLWVRVFCKLRTYKILIFPASQGIFALT